MSDEYHGHSAPDVSKKASFNIWLYFLLLGLILFATIGGLTIYFRHQLESEQRQKIGQVETSEVLDYRSKNKSVLSGEKGIIEGKNNVSIEEAMKKFISMARANKNERATPDSFALVFCYRT